MAGTNWYYSTKWRRVFYQEANFVWNPHFVSRFKWPKQRSKRVNGFSRLHSRSVHCESSGMLTAAVGVCTPWVLPISFLLIGDSVLLGPKLVSILLPNAVELESWPYNGWSFLCARQQKDVQHHSCIFSCNRHWFPGWGKAGKLIYLVWMLCETICTILCVSFCAKSDRGRKKRQSERLLSLVWG